MKAIKRTQIMMQYIRHPKTKKPYGLVVAIGPNQFGYSLCHDVDKKVWNKETARIKAIGRATPNRHGNKDFTYWVNNITFKIVSGDEKNVKIDELERVKSDLMGKLSKYDPTKIYRLKALTVLYYLRNIAKKAKNFNFDKESINKDK